ncbi:MAG: hypothetical protein IK130_04900 [Oscillospiraceae bacterium]|nr:hypothetical protein [Oscillospiraceae bacterium]
MKRKAPNIPSLILLLIVSVTIFLIPVFANDLLTPDTMIGKTGLKQVHQYAGMLLFTYLGSALIIPAAIELDAHIRRKREGEPLLTAVWRIPISVVLTLSYLLLYPKTSAAEMQSQSLTDSSYVIVRMAVLYGETGKDLRENETVPLGTIPVQIQQKSYKYTLTTGSSYTGYRTESAFEHETGLFTESDILIGQITGNESGKVRRSAFPYQKHTIETYKHSGLIASVDGLGQFPYSGKWEDMITLTYDYDAGVLRRELLCEDESTMPDMHLKIQMDSDEFGSSEGGHQIINGLTAIAFKPMIPGKAKAWIEFLDKGIGWQRVSNIIEYTQTDYVYQTLPDRGDHIAASTTDGFGTVLTDETYRFQLTYPAKYQLKILHEEAEDTGFGSDREILETAEGGEMHFGFYALERPWSKPVSEAYEVQPGIDSEMDDRRRQLSNGRTLLSETREGEWRVQEWETDDGASVVLAMYPLTDVQYLEARFAYRGAEYRAEIGQIMHSLTVMP